MAAKNLLPGPMGPEVEETISAGELLQVCADNGHRQSALVYPMPADQASAFKDGQSNRRGRLWVDENYPRAIVVHQKPRKTLANMFATHIPTGHSVCMLFRGIKKDLKPWLDKLDLQKSSFNSRYPAFVDMLKVAMHPHPNRPAIGHDLVVWTDARHIVKRDEGAPSARLGGRVIGFGELGALWHAVINRQPMNLKEVRTASAESFAAPAEIQWRGSTAVIGNRAFRYYAGQLDYAQIAALMTMRNVDVMFRIESHSELIERTQSGRTLAVEGRPIVVIYATVYIRSESRVTGSPTDPKFPDFEQVEELLPKLGTWIMASETSNQLTLREAFRYFIPGGKYPKWIKRHSMPSPNKVMEYLGGLVTKADDAGGDLAIARNTQGFPILVRNAENPIALVFGPTGSGKSAFTETVLALQRTQRVLQIKCAFKMGIEMGLQWVGMFGGKVYSPGHNDTIKVPLPDGIKLSADGRLLDENSEDRQKILLEWAQQEAAQHALVDFQLLAQGKPIAIYPNADTVWYYHYVRWYWRAFAYFWESKKVAKSAVLIWDDVTKIVPAVPSTSLGNIPVHVGEALRHEIRGSISTCRKLGWYENILAHSLEGMSTSFPQGTVTECTLAIQLFKDGHQFANIIDPSSAEFLDGGEPAYSRVQINLGDQIAEIFGQPTLEDQV